MAQPPRRPPARGRWPGSRPILAVIVALVSALGIAALVRQFARRRAAPRAIAPAPPAPALPESPPALALAPPPELMPAPRRELAAPGEVAPAMTDDRQPAPPPVPAAADAAPPAAAPDLSGDSRARRYPLLAAPHVLLAGPVDHAMYASFRDQLRAAPASGTLVIAISTLGGDPEVARLMGDEVRLMREYSGRELLFLGKVAVYSAGATFMAAFPVEKRFLTKETRIMIHERQMTSTIQLSGPLKSLTATLRAKLHEIEHSVMIEEEGFRDLVAGSKIAFAEVCDRAASNWYIEAEEARDLGLVLDVI